MKKQNKFMTFILSMILALTLVLPGNAVNAKADGQGDMATDLMQMKWYSI